jgi:hypothetical protein
VKSVLEVEYRQQLGPATPAGRHHLMIILSLTEFEESEFSGRSLFVFKKVYIYRIPGFGISGKPVYPGPNPYTRAKI